MTTIIKNGGPGTIGEFVGDPNRTQPVILKRTHPEHFGGKIIDGDEFECIDCGSVSPRDEVEWTDAGWACREACETEPDEEEEKP